jgi:hypothetical protein
MTKNKTDHALVIDDEDLSRGKLNRNDMHGTVGQIGDMHGTVLQVEVTQVESIKTDATRGRGKLGLTGD